MSRDFPTNVVRRAHSLAAPVLLLVLLLVAYGHALQLPFLNDDYFLLEKASRQHFLQVWEPTQLYFNWYRPASRELHYWAMEHAVGLVEWPYHAFSFVLWIGSVLLYFRFVRKISGPETAATATVGVIALALWSGPLLWIAGAQDLWMLLYSMLFLSLVVEERRAWLALAVLLLALLSKETAAVLPGIALAYHLIVRGESIRRALSRTWLYFVATALWAALHPTLRDRFFGRFQESLETEHRPTPLVTILKTILAQFNLDGALKPEHGWGSVILRGILAAAILILLLAYWRRRGRAGEEQTPPRSRLVGFALIWAALGLVILLMPSIGWHAYYGVLGTLGFWIAVGALLSRSRRSAVAVILCLALLREARATTPSWDWGTDWYQTRAGAILEGIRAKLFLFHPTFPPHSRLYFAHIPNNIGLLAGDGPAIRVWYRDSTLAGRFYSQYRPPSRRDLGRDYFFRFDSLQALVEVVAGPENLNLALQTNPSWQNDHDVLASLFMHAGEYSAAAPEYGKLALALPNQPAYAIYSGAAFEASGNPSAAKIQYRLAARSLGDSTVARMARELLASLPAPGDANR